MLIKFEKQKQNTLNTQHPPPHTQDILLSMYRKINNSSVIILFRFYLDIFYSREDQLQGYRFTRTIFSVIQSLLYMHLL